MTRKADEGLEEIKSPPQRVPWSDLSEELASRKPATSQTHHFHYKQENQYEEAVAMEEGVLFKEKEKIQGADSQILVAEKGISIEDPDTSGGQCVVSPSRHPDVGPSAEALGTGVHHPTVGRRARIPERVLPGAYREGGLDNEEEDEVTIQSNTEPPIPPPVLAELVDENEEERRRQDDIKKAKEEALEDARKKAVVAQAVPEVISKRDKRWKFAGALLLLLLIAVGVLLGIKLRSPTEPETFIPQDLIDFLANASSDSGEALRKSSTPQHKALVWLAGDENLANYSEQKKIQRYALATLYYSTNGGGWRRNDKWLSDADVCGQWFQNDNTTINCTAGAVSTVDLDENSLMGMVPAEIGMLSDSLEELWLQSNELSGTIPTEIASLTKLSKLYLNDNVLNGTIPTELGLLSNLEELDLELNQLTGTISTCLASLPLLEELYPPGTIPINMASLPLLSKLSLDKNYLNGTIPTELGLLSNLVDLDLDTNRLTGSIPTSLVGLPLLTGIYLYKNVLSDTMPTELGLLSNLEELFLYSNQFTGTIPTSLVNLPLLTELKIFDNDLNGTIPTELGLLSNLEWLNLYSNQLIGTIPTELGLLSSLVYLNVSSNQLTGTVPTSLAGLPLNKLYLADTNLTGSLDAFCNHTFEAFVANICGQDEMNCTCCTHCCQAAPSSQCCDLETGKCEWI